jgi:hypothetical protein
VGVYGCAVDERGEPLTDIAQRYVAAVCAVSDATDAAITLGEGPLSAVQALEYVVALRRMIGIQREALAVFDRFIARADQVGLAWQELAELRGIRAGLVLGVQDAMKATEQVDRTSWAGPPRTR